MSKVRVDGLPVGFEAVLHAQVAGREAGGTWQRVGSVRMTEQGPVVTWDADCRYLESLWRPAARLGGGRDGGKTIRFCVFEGRRCEVVAERWVSAEELVQLRQQFRPPRSSAPRGLGVGPRGVRSGWPRF